MSASALFALKLPSLLPFDRHARTEGVIRHHLKTLFGVQCAPSDTQMREVLDRVNSREIRRVFKVLFSKVQRGKLLEEFVSLNSCDLMALDGTGYFSSQKIFCKNCCRKEQQNGQTTYSHQILSAVLIHPKKRGVIPFAPEPMIKTEGKDKNDCERNAAESFLKDFRREHPHLQGIVTEDGLSSNAPHIQTLQSLKMHFILGCKPGDHKTLFKFIEGSDRIGAMNEHEIQEEGVLHRFRWLNGVSLNDSNPNCKVHFLHYSEQTSKKTTHWSWVTD